MSRPGPPKPRRGTRFAHPLGLMRVLAVTGDDVVFTYDDDEDGEQYPRSISLVDWYSRYARKRR